MLATTERFIVSELFRVEMQVREPGKQFRTVFYTVSAYTAGFATLEAAKYFQNQGYEVAAFNAIARPVPFKEVRQK